VEAVSGGSLNYIHSKIEMAADDLRHHLRKYPHDHQDRLAAFATAMDRFADLTRAVEWDLSSDASLEPADLFLIDALAAILEVRP
jgi:hypothetical protein